MKVADLPPMEAEQVPRDVMTSLPNGNRVRKDDLRMEACGSIDELNSFLGLLQCELPIELVSEVQDIQRKLFAVGAAVVGAQKVQNLPSTTDVEFLRHRIAEFTEKCGKLTTFILPGGCHAAALAHVCRTVCRRAERQIVATESYVVVPYMNRLSTYLFYLARYLNLFYGFNEKHI